MKLEMTYTMHLTEKEAKTLSTLISGISPVDAEQKYGIKREAWYEIEQICNLIPYGKER